MMKKPITILAILLYAFLGFFFLKGKIVYKKFDSHVWKTANLNKEENWSLRWNMMNDLRNRYKLVGITKKEIIDLLGKPDGSTKSEFRYYLGYSKTGINTGILTISFDEKEIATAIKVWQG